MKTGAAETDAYLAEWRKADPVSIDGDPADIAHIRGRAPGYGV